MKLYKTYKFIKKNNKQYGFSYIVKRRSKLSVIKQVFNYIKKVW